MPNGVDFYTNRYALIKDGIVTNVIMVDSYPTAGLIAQAQSADEAICVDQYLVTIGDTYADGVFTHLGNEIERQINIEEKAVIQEGKIDQLEMLILQMQGVI